MSLISSQAPFSDVNYAPSDSGPPSPQTAQEVADKTISGLSEETRALLENRRLEQNPLPPPGGDYLIPPRFKFSFNFLMNNVQLLWVVG